jgi:8-oxo-dGTP pyrophosphatase MutT (NUDIX family)
MARTIEEVSAGALVILEHRQKQPRIVLLTQNNSFYKRPKDYGIVVDIGPKGPVLEGESLEDAAERRIEQELGMDLKIDNRFKEEYEYEFDENIEGETVHIRKRVIYFVAVITEQELQKIRLSEEHSKVEITSLAEAIAMVKFPEQRKILAKCDEFLLLNVVK